MRCYAWKLVEALLVGLLLAAFAVACSERHLMLWPHETADSTVSVPASPTGPEGACLDPVFGAMVADHHGGAVVTAC